MFSDRIAHNLTRNRLAQAVEAMRAAQKPYIDLTESNPTRAGFHYPSDLLQPLAQPRALTYEPSPLGALGAREARSAVRRSRRRDRRRRSLRRLRAGAGCDGPRRTRGALRRRAHVRARRFVEVTRVAAGQAWLGGRRRTGRAGRRGP